MNMEKHTEVLYLYVVDITQQVESFTKKISKEGSSKVARAYQPA